MDNAKWELYQAMFWCGFCALGVIVLRHTGRHGVAVFEAALCLYFAARALYWARRI